MQNELSRLTESATQSNLDKLFSEASLNVAKRALELRDIADSAALLYHSLLDSGLDTYEIFSLISSRLGLGDYPRGAALSSIGEEAISFDLRLTSVTDRLILSGLLVKAIRDRGHELHESLLFGEAPSEPRIAYVRNSYADEAYDVFSQEFRYPKVLYKDNFKACAESLDSLECGYCLLPLEEHGARLSSVAELIYRYDLKINSVTPVFGYLMDADVKYALVSRHFRYPLVHEGDDIYLELRLSSFETLLAKVLLAAEYFGLSLYRTDTTTVGASEDTTTFLTVVLRSGGVELIGILTYLLLFLPDAVPVGLYKNLE